MTSTIRIGTRSSALAIEQTRRVADALRAIAPEIEISVETMSSAGDQEANAPLESLGIGVFTKTIETAVIEGSIDLAIHSLKDLPTEIPKGLAVVAVLEREDPRDVLVDRWNKPLLDLPEGARIGTSSPRRAAQLRYGRKDIEFLPIRGNVETRLRKAEGPDYDGTVLAAAGVRRLGLESKVTEYLSSRVCTPAPGQAALAAEVRSDDEQLLALVHAIEHGPTAQAVAAERSILRAAGGGCQLPIGALAEVEDGMVKLFATVTPIDGSQSFRVEITGPADDPEVAGMAAYQALLEQGAGPLMHGDSR